MYYPHFETTVFENVDDIIEIELMVPSHMHAKNLGILWSLELQKIRIVLFVVESIVNYFQSDV